MDRISNFFGKDWAWMTWTISLVAREISPTVKLPTRGAFLDTRDWRYSRKRNNQATDAWSLLKEECVWSRHSRMSSYNTKWICGFFLFNSGSSSQQSGIWKGDCSHSLSCLPRKAEPLSQLSNFSVSRIDKPRKAYVCRIGLRVHVPPLTWWGRIVNYRQSVSHKRLEPPCLVTDVLKDYSRVCPKQFCELEGQARLQGTYASSQLLLQRSAPSEELW